MKRFLIKVHRWLGFPVGLLFVLAFGTGFITAIDEIQSRRNTVNLPALDLLIVSETPKQRGDMVAYLFSTHSDARQIELPTQNHPYYHVHKRGESFIYEIGNTEPIQHTEESRGGFFDTVLQLHRNLLLGRDGLFGIEGKYYMAWVALISLLLSLLGLYIWWPLRRTFKTKDILPRSFKRKTLYYSHMTSGVVVLVAIIPLALTGAGITYRDVAKAVLGVSEQETSALEMEAMPNHWQAWLNEAQAQVPSGQLQSIRLPRQRPQGRQLEQGQNASQKQSQNANRENTAKPNAETSTVQLVYQAPGDWWGLANTRVSIDTKLSKIVKVELFEELDLGNKIYAVMVPLHTGRNLPVAYVFVLAIFSFIGTAMVASGIVSFLRKKRKYPKLNFARAAFE